MTATTRIALAPRRRVTPVAPLRRAAVVLVALVLALSGTLAAVLAPAPVRAATPELTLVTATTYDVLPSEARVAVTVDIVATSHKADTVTRRYYFTAAYLAVLPGASGFTITSPAGTPSVSVAKRDSTVTLLKLGFPQQLGSGASEKLQLQFSLKDPGGAPDRQIRVGSTLVALSLWAYGTPDTPGSSVTLRIPAGFTVQLGRGPIAGPTTDPAGRQVWTTGALDVPLAWILDVTADRPGAYVESHRSTRVGGLTALIVIRSWPDDPGWEQRVGDLVLRGLPVLHDAIGAPWPIVGEVSVEETLLRTTGGYAGLFDPSLRRLQISYTAAPGVILHEAAHAWFNGRMVADRWTAEAFASYYAEVAAAVLKVTIDSPELTTELRLHAIPLNAWGAIGTEDDLTEGYAYAASLALARAIGERAGTDALQRVWADAAAGIGAYRPGSGDPEPAASPPDWRGLLDLLEDASGKRFDDLWRQWVARPEDLAQLDARVAARGDYAETVRLAGDWLLPRSIREAMRAWRFDEATRLCAAARSVVQQRSAIDAAATRLGLTPPAALRAAFEGDQGLDAAAAEADVELAALRQIDVATSVGAAAPPGGLLEAIGRFGVDPMAKLDLARAAFERGDPDGAVAAARDAETQVTTAADVGRGRLISAALLGGALVVLAGIFTGRRRRRRGEHAGPA